MSRTTSLLILFAAATLEAGGDAIMRVGLHTSSPSRRALLFAFAAAALFCYGWTVNAPPWDFGKLLGLYVVFFFLIAEIISWAFFKQPPAPSVCLGGAFIVLGGAIIALKA